MSGIELVGHTVEKQLDACLWRLVSAEIGLHDLTPALAGFYSVGFNDGQESMAAERDRLYERLYYGKELPDVRLRRMRAGAAAYWEEFVHERVRDIIEDRGRA